MVAARTGNFSSRLRQERPKRTSSNPFNFPPLGVVPQRAPVWPAKKEEYLRHTAAGGAPPSNQHACELMKVARVYGAKPEIYTRLSWMLWSHWHRRRCLRPPCGRRWRGASSPGRAHRRADRGALKAGNLGRQAAGAADSRITPVQPAGSFPISLNANARWWCAHALFRYVPGPPTNVLFLDRAQF
jgi:hypothetical protein